MENMPSVLAEKIIGGFGDLSRAELTALARQVLEEDARDAATKGEKSFIGKSIEHALLGNYASEKTLLGTGIQILLSMTGLDLPMDLRDLVYDLTHWEWTPEHIAGTLFDTVGLVPVVGAVAHADVLLGPLLRYGDELLGWLKASGASGEILEAAGALMKRADLAAASLGFAKRGDELGEVAEGILKHGDELAEAAGTAIKGGDEAAEALADAARAAGDAADTSGTLGKSADMLIESAGKTSKIPWDSWQNYEKVITNGQEYAKVGDRLYSRHAVNRMQPSGNRFGPNIYLGLYGEDYGRSVAPQFVEDVIHSVKPFIQDNGNLVYISGTVKVVTNQQGSVITIVTYVK